MNKKWYSLHNPTWRERWGRAVRHVVLHVRIAALNATERPRTIDLTTTVTRLHTDGSEWHRSPNGNLSLVRFPTNYDTPELRATLRQRQYNAVAGWLPWGVHGAL